MTCLNGVLFLALAALAAVCVARIGRNEWTTIVSGDANYLRDECERVGESTGLAVLGFAALVCATCYIATLIDGRPSVCPLAVGLTVWAQVLQPFCAFQSGKLIGVALCFTRTPKSAQDGLVLAGVAALTSLCLIGSHVIEASLLR